MPSSSAQPFAHVVAPNAGLYRAAMAAFVDAKRRFVVHLRPEDVHDAVGPTADADLATVTEALNKLVEWENLRADPDTGRVTTVEDFHRARFLYQLTREGEAAERALGVYDEQLGQRGALQAVALSDIATQLRALHELARQADPDSGRTSLLLRGLVARCEDLAGNAQAFMGSLQRTIDLYDADVDAFRAYKNQLVGYLERFVKDLVTIGGEIAGLLGELEATGVSRLLETVARRDAEDAAPGAAAEGEELDDDPQEAAFVAGLHGWEERWRGLRQWFVSEPRRPSQAKLLRARARAAIPQLLAVVATLNERRAGRSDRSADFRALACWFAEAPDEDAMHRLWRVAFGLYGSRHLVVDRETLAAREEEPIPATTPWAQAPPLRISPQLRRTGTYERRGRPNRVLDRASDRQRLEQLAARQVAETAAARARLATDRPLRLRELGELDAAAFSLFLTLLADALAARRPDQREVATTTADGTMSIRLTALDDGEIATIHTPSGVFRGPDHLVEIADLAPRAEASETADSDPGELAA